MHNNYLNILTVFFNANPFVKIIILIMVGLSIYSWAVIFSKIKLINNHFKLINTLRKIVSNSTNSLTLKTSFIQVRNNYYSQIFNYIEANKSNLFSSDGGVNSLVKDSLNKYLYINNEKLNENLHSLASITNIAPFIGLLGTVIGIINSFTLIGQNASVSLVTIAPGIGEALYSTAIGLFVAIPASLAYNYFTAKLNKLTELQDLFLIEIITPFSKSKNNKIRKDEEEYLNEDVLEEVSLKNISMKNGLLNNVEGIRENKNTRLNKDNKRYDKKR